MNITFVQTENIQNLLKSLNAIEARDRGVPGLGLVHGRAGRGKTRSAIWYSVQKDCCYVRANALWTPLWMLQDICREYGHYPFNRTSKVFDQVKKLMQIQPKPLLIDEADYLLRNGKLLDSVRDLHDCSDAPIILIGMEEITGRLQRHGQFWSRISQIVEFHALTAAEISLIAKAWANLTLGGEASVEFCRVTSGDFRDVTVGLYHLEKMAKSSRTDSVSSKMIAELLKLRKKRRADKERQASRGRS